MAKKLTQLERGILSGARGERINALYGKQFSVRRSTHEKVQGHGWCRILHESYRARIEHDYSFDEEDTGKYNLLIYVAKNMYFNVKVQPEVIHRYILERDFRTCYLYIDGLNVYHATNEQLSPRQPRIVMASDVTIAKNGK